MCAKFFFAQKPNSPPTTVLEVHMERPPRRRAKTEGYMKVTWRHVSLVSLLEDKLEDA